MRFVFAVMLILLAAGCVQTESMNADEKTPPALVTPFPTKVAIQNSSPNPKYFDYYVHVPPDESVNHTLIVKFPIVRSPMPYYVYNETQINDYKFNITIENIRKAFGMWEDASGRRVKFVRLSSAPEDGIIIRLVTNLSGDTIGEAAPYGVVLQNYTLITGGDMELEPTYGGMENLVQIVHEIGHIMGLGHVTDSHSVMYPWNAYSQVITPEIEKALDTLYKGIPETD